MDSVLSFILIVIILIDMIAGYRKGFIRVTVEARYWRSTLHFVSTVGQESSYLDSYPECRRWSRT